MKYQLLLFCLLGGLVAKSQTDVPLNVPAIGHGAPVNSPTFRFNYLGFPVGHYALGWYENEGAPVGYLSGYTGLKFFTAGSPRMTINHAGNVGVGTTLPTEKLSVNGKIRALEIKVETANWPDYVFKPEYQFPSLKETEKHIKEKGHLPGIPSAKEVKNNGIDLGEMNAKLLQKIEELTLHLIEMEKKNEKQQAQIDKLNLNIK